MLDNERLPEGFAADSDGSYQGIPARFMRAANALLCSVTGEREWDVPHIATSLRQQEYAALLWLRDELGKPGWYGADAGWDYAIAQVRRLIRETTGTWTGE